MVWGKRVVIKVGSVLQEVHLIGIGQRMDGTRLLMFENDAHMISIKLASECECEGVEYAFQAQSLAVNHEIKRSS